MTEVPPPGVVVEAQERANFENKKVFITFEAEGWVISTSRPGEKRRPDGSIDLYERMTVVAPMWRRKREQVA